MKTISGIIGLVLILVAVVIVVLSTSNETKLANQKAMIEKYVAQSSKALNNENIADAIKFAKLAIAVDPGAKAGYKAYDKALETKYKPSQEEMQYDNSPAMPSAPAAADEEVDMGC